ncbi:hypothetical protein C5167_005494 [Papaver somniferum]|uniref:Bet v I/Major latex protein domain-containing protein n=1 Tax=Papaver somniferum TaxID=3469 RepID=A0A4Y7JEL0_PAPSO|nr:major latex protein 146-like [Papaver somniferum]RZC58189.1 hypothetical protein C5167_005494 [Papaver somniferum]
MAQLHKLGFEAETKCSADKYFGMFSYNVTQLPKFVPSMFKSVEITEGDGTSIGSSRLWKYTIEGPEMALKDRLTSFNKEKRSMAYEFTEGEIMNYYKTLNVKLDVVPKQCATGNGSFVKWSLEFEKVNADIPDPTAYMDALQLVTNELSSRLY